MYNESDSIYYQYCILSVTYRENQCKLEKCQDREKLSIYTYSVVAHKEIHQHVFNHHHSEIFCIRKQEIRWLLLTELTFQKPSHFHIIGKNMFFYKIIDSSYLSTILLESRNDNLSSDITMFIKLTTVTPHTYSTPTIISNIRNLEGRMMNQTLPIHPPYNHPPHSLIINY